MNEIYETWAYNFRKKSFWTSILFQRLLSHGSLGTFKVAGTTCPGAACCASRSQHESASVTWCRVRRTLCGRWSCVFSFVGGRSPRKLTWCAVQQIDGFVDASWLCVPWQWFWFTVDIDQCDKCFKFVICLSCFGNIPNMHKI